MNVKNQIQKVVQEKYLHFDNLNFKLAIIQVLMYDLEVLKPAFDIFDFSEEFSELDIDTESTELVEPALEYFKIFRFHRSMQVL